ncbi:hypothetical protein SUDANB58_00345 [Streptomyces sp. enrichment culture]|uniref:DUF6777 domain-containing protein n=1 Tax=Streptomyces sp. enrichment culture TaxID=1795815 RepID=UPI003F56BF09
MSVEPPSSGRPTGPPSGPLSGPSPPPSGPPSPPPPSPPGGGDGGAPQPRRPWWRSAPRLAVLAAVVVAAVVLAVVFSRPGGDGPGDGGGGTGNRSGEVFLQAAGSTGPDPFTRSTAKDSSVPPASAPAASPATASAPAHVVRSVDGGAPGLYGGTRNASSCDVERQIDALGADPAKNRAFASVARVEPSEVPAHLRGLTPVQLRLDTRVTNHGYRDGKAVPYQAVLQAGTAVLVDDRGVPRVRCACGNPLTEPVPQPSPPRTTGDAWPSYNPSNVVVVQPAPRDVDAFVLYDPERDEWISRPRGDTGDKDRPTAPPAERPSPSPGVSTPASPPTTAPDRPSPPTEPQSPPSGSGTTAPGTPEPATPEPGTTAPGTTAPGPGEPQPGSPATGSPPASVPSRSASVTGAPVPPAAPPVL